MTDVIAKPESTSVTPMRLIETALAQDADLDKLERLWELQQKWEANEARKAFNNAMAAFRAECPKIGKNRSVSFGGKSAYKHATLDHVIEVIQPVLAKHGLSFSWRVDQKGETIGVTCIVTHVHGHQESTTMYGAPDKSGSKNSIQAIGSTTTYLQRYTLFSILGLAAGEDDDASAAANEQSILARFDDPLAAIQSAKSPNELRAIWKELDSEQRKQFDQDIKARLEELK
ncbi:ERF family protein [Candidatus Parcubacteria bacterium]|nr:MAG: ERF family protein [Candidatus Parcubacteria bacterium]